MTLSTDRQVIRCVRTTVRVKRVVSQGPRGCSIYPPGPDFKHPSSTLHAHSKHTSSTRHPFYPPLDLIFSFFYQFFRFLIFDYDFDNFVDHVLTIFYQLFDAPDPLKVWKNTGKITFFTFSTFLFQGPFSSPKMTPKWTPKWPQNHLFLPPFWFLGRSRRLLERFWTLSERSWCLPGPSRNY